MFHSFIHSFIHSLMALQPFVVPWPLLNLCNLFYTDGRTPWTSDHHLARPLPTHRTKQTQNKRTHWHPCLSGTRAHDPSVRASEESSCLRPGGHSNRRWWDAVFASLVIFGISTEIMGPKLYVQDQLFLPFPSFLSIIFFLSSHLQHYMISPIEMVVRLVANE
jgi:hypothetical protein